MIKTKRNVWLPKLLDVINYPNIRLTIGNCRKTPLNETLNPYVK